jgi:hypothetical protein
LSARLLAQNTSSFSQENYNIRLVLATCCKDAGTVHGHVKFTPCSHQKKGQLRFDFRLAFKHCDDICHLGFGWSPSIEGTSKLRPAPPGREDWPEDGSTLYVWANANKTGFILQSLVHFNVILKLLKRSEQAKYFHFLSRK